MRQRTPFRSPFDKTAAALAVGGLIAAGALLPLAARAAPVLSYGDITIDAVAQARLYDAGVISDPPPALLPAGDARKIEAFASHPESGPGWYYGGFQLGTPTRHPTQNFASAQMNGRGFADLGVSGVSEGPTIATWGSLSSQIVATQRLSNVGGAGTVKLDYTIPLLEIAHYGTRYEGLVASVGAFLFISRFDSTGRFVEDLEGFRYQFDFHYEKPPTTYAILTFTASEDLLRDSAGVVDVTDNCILLLKCGAAVRPFSVSREIGELDEGDYLEYTYVMSAYYVNGREGGGHALYGDPLAFTGGGGRNFFEFSAADGPGGVVPAPASALLLGLGCAMLGSGRRARAATAR